MDATTFDREWRAFVRRRPFQSFTVEFSSGGTIEVEHPEALVFRSGVAVYIDVHGLPTLVDHAGVTRLICEIDPATSAYMPVPLPPPSPSPHSPPAPPASARPSGPVSSP